MGADFWFVDRENNQRGPVAREEIANLIRKGAIGRMTQVWAEGMTEWQTADEVEDFSSVFALLAPPAPSESTARAPSRTESITGYQTANVAAALHTSASPVPGFRATATETQAAHVLKLLFSLYGRLNRGNFWIMLILSFIVSSTSLYIIDGRLTRVIDENPDLDVGTVYIVTELFIVIILAYMLFSIQVKRLHDLNKSWLLSLLLLIPIVGWIVLITINTQRGSPDPNVFGAPDTFSLFGRNSENDTNVVPSNLGAITKPDIWTRIVRTSNFISNVRMKLIFLFIAVLIVVPIVMFGYNLLNAMITVSTHNTLTAEFVRTIGENVAKKQMIAVISEGIKERGGDITDSTTQDVMNKISECVAAKVFIGFHRRGSYPVWQRISGIIG